MQKITVFSPEKDQQQCNSTTGSHTIHILSISGRMYSTSAAIVATAPLLGNSNRFITVIVMGDIMYNKAARNPLCHRVSKIK